MSVNTESSRSMKFIMLPPVPMNVVNVDSDWWRWVAWERHLQVLDNFYIVDEESEKLWQAIVDQLNAVRRHSDQHGLVYCCLLNRTGVCRNAPSDACTKFFQLLLGTGINPSVVVLGKRDTPAHICGLLDHDNIEKYARSLSILRLDIQARNMEGLTPEEIARKYIALPLGDQPCTSSTNRRLAVAEIWRNAQTQGQQPSIAQLAASGYKWWAVKNLCRRGVFRNSEMDELYKGKTALQWAQHHGQSYLAKELRYLFKKRLESNSVPQHEILVTDGPPATVDQDKAGDNKTADEVSQMETAINSTDDDHDHHDREISLLKEHVLQLQEGLMVTASKADEEIKALQGKMENIEMENVALKEKLDEIERKFNQM